MKKPENRNNRMIIGIIMIGLMVSFSACNQQSPLESNNNSNVGTLGKVSTNTGSEYLFTGNDENLYGDVYLQSNSLVVEYSRPLKGYQRGLMNLPNGSKFEISAGALTPPAGTRNGESVTITMTCERDTINNELLFTYGPCGSQFLPPAKLTLNWKDLNIDIPKLYYIEENGNYIEQTPDDIDVNGKNLIIYVYHFSRYAVAWSR